MTDSQDLVVRLTQLASTRFAKEGASLRPNDDMFDALGIDSMRAMELLTEVEQHFGIEIPDYELQGVMTFEALAEVIGRRL